mmetsp:Transcript_22346/g.71494  ORF Transcript_22346/g.71494 Transcript_22346/m.71494 type:complete len:209 (-) Transcript_22346:173-799(-)
MRQILRENHHHVGAAQRFLRAFQRGPKRGPPRRVWLVALVVDLAHVHTEVLCVRVATVGGVVHGGHLRAAVQRCSHWHSVDVSRQATVVENVLIADGLLPVCRALLTVLLARQAVIVPVREQPLYGIAEKRHVSTAPARVVSQALTKAIMRLHDVAEWHVGARRTLASFFELSVAHMLVTLGHVPHPVIHLCSILQNRAQGGGADLAE